MKRIAFAALAAITALAMTGCNKPVKQGDNVYYMSGTVTRIVPQADGSQRVSITTVDGRIYDIDGWDFRVNDNCGLMMNSRGTITPIDDIVYDAWVTD